MILVRCTCANRHADDCPNSLHVTGEEINAFCAFYGLPEEFEDAKDGAGLDGYNQRMFFFVAGMRAAQAAFITSCQPNRTITVGR